MLVYRVYKSEGPMLYWNRILKLCNQNLKCVNTINRRHKQGSLLCLEIVATEISLNNGMRVFNGLLKIIAMFILYYRFRHAY